MSKAVGNAMFLLGLDAAMPLSLLQPATVRAAFAQRAKESHPDTGTETGVTMRQLQAARNLLLESIEQENRACPVCQGSGKMRGRLGAVDCVGCSGTGRRE